MNVPKAVSRLGFAVAVCATFASWATLAVGQAHAAPSVPAAPTAEEAVQLKMNHLRAAAKAQLNQGVEQDLIIELDASRAGEWAKAQRLALGLRQDSADLLRGKKAIFDEDKRSALRQSSIAGVTLLDDYDALPMHRVKVRHMAALKALLGRKEIVRVYPNEAHSAHLMQSLPLIGQPAVAASGLVGAGRSIAILDTGVDYTRAAFGGCVAPGVPASCKVKAAMDFAPDDGQLDDNGHGSNVAAIASAVAPGANIIAADVFRTDQLAYTDDLIRAINWVINNAASQKIVAMNLSLGIDANSPGDCPSSWAATPFMQARAVGVLPVVSAGNDARTAGLGLPACTPGAVSVGAVYDANMGGLAWNNCVDATTAADQVVCFSNSANNLLLLAPGAQMTAAGTTFSGTSQAAPHVAGAVAVLRAAFPNESADATLSRLILSGRRVADPRNGLLKPRLDLTAAVKPGLRSALVSSRWVSAQGGFWDAQQWVSGDFDGDGKSDLAKVFNDGGNASIDVHPARGGTFAMGRWANRQGGFWDAQKWLAGDFNGDGKTDLVNVFNCGNATTCIDMHLSNGSSFGIQRWASGQGGFWSAQQWVVGDFNGDGKADLAKVFNDGGSASIDVHLSTGSSFGMARWATRQGGFWDAQKWLAGDFNGDGKADLANAFNDGGSATIDMHLSSGSSFGIARWATQQGGFWDAQKWAVGDFNGDGLADLAKVLNDGGSATIDVHYSMGNSFDLTRQETRAGGFWNTQKWLVGDFNGDRKADFANAFLDNGQASIDVHR